VDRPDWMRSWLLYSWLGAEAVRVNEGQRLGDAVVRVERARSRRVVIWGDMV